MNFLNFKFKSGLRYNFFKRHFWKEKNEKQTDFGQYKIVVPGNVSPPRHVPDHIEKPPYWSDGCLPPGPDKPEIKSKDQIVLLKNSCQVASKILKSLRDFIKIGTTTDDIDRYVHDCCISENVYPSPLNYMHFPKSVCTSVNNVACHGIPDDRHLESGDILNVDITIFKNGMHGDCSAMFLVGNVDEEGQKLCRITKEAMAMAIDICRPGVKFAKIGQIIEKHVKKNNFTVIPCFTGHGIGSYFHGPPSIYHFNYPYKGRMQAGMTFTIEPVIGQGDKEIVILEDGWTAVTEDNSRTAQWEHTVLITEEGFQILTN